MHMYIYIVQHHMNISLWMYPIMLKLLVVLVPYLMKEELHVYIVLYRDYCMGRHMHTVHVAH